jgi:hypothetical protein
MIGNTFQSSRAPGLKWVITSETHSDKVFFFALSFCFRLLLGGGDWPPKLADPAYTILGYSVVYIVFRPSGMPRGIKKKERI